MLGGEVSEECGPVFGADRVGPLTVLFVFQRLREVLRIESLDPIPRVREDDLATLDREGRWPTLTIGVVEDVEASRGGVRVVVAVSEDSDVLRTRPDSSDQPDEDTETGISLPTNDAPS